MKPAAAYIRVSTDDQTEYSPDAQIRAIRNWASAHDYFVPDEFVFADEGISGRKANRRPAFMRMIGMAKTKPAPFDAILVHKFDRFARSREDSVVYKSMLRRECGVQVISITESIEDDKFSVILEAMLEAMAEYYSINLAEEVRKGMTEKALRGERQSRAPFGYRSEGNTLIPDPEQAGLVREIFKRFADGAPYFEIARWLNNMGVRTRRGNAFQNRTVKYILCNPTYIGVNCWTPGNRPDNSSGYQIIDSTIRADANHEPLIDRELWDTVQVRITANKERYGHEHRSSQHADWPSGLARCPHCGSVMVRSFHGHLADGQPAVYWLCNGYAHALCKHTNNFPDALFKSIVIESIRNTSADMDSLISAIREAYRARNNPYPAALERIDAQLERARDAYRMGVDTLEEYASAKAKLFEMRDKIEEEQKKLLTPNEGTLAQHAEQISKTLMDMADFLESDAPTVDKHCVAHEIINRIVINKLTGETHLLLNSDFIARSI